jgi:hypothetical protein
MKQVIAKSTFSGFNPMKTKPEFGMEYASWLSN